jgi:exonuclease III
MRVITWNMRRAKTGSPSWEYFNEIDPDVALLQEINELPESIIDKYDHKYLKACSKSGKDQQFGTAVLVKGRVSSDLDLSSEIQWIHDEIKLFKGNLVGCVIEPYDSEPINVISAYSPAWPVDKKRLHGIDLSGIKLDDNPDLWLTEILWCALKHADIKESERWIVAGDLNSSETFDVKWGPRGNKQVMDRMKDLGLYECLKGFQRVLTPTFRHSSGKIEDQLDHLFVTQCLTDELIDCKAGSKSLVFDKSLSDHLPIIAEFSD